MTFKEFYISDNDGKSNCVIRSLCKILNEKYDNNLFYPSKTQYMNYHPNLNL